MKRAFMYLGHQILSWVAVAFLFWGWCPVPSDANDFSGAGNDPGGRKTLVIGKVSLNPKKHYRYLRPMVEYAASHMEDLGIRGTKVLMARDNRQMVNYLRQGKVDWVTETIFSSVVFHEKAGAVYLLKKWKKGVGEYDTLFFTRKDSAVKTLSDLKGKVITFEDPGSTSAYYVPASILLFRGLKLVQLANVREKPPPDMVGYLFSGQEINTSTWVHRGLADAGAFSNLDWHKDDHMRKEQRKDMRILYRKESIPRAIELVRKDLDPQITARLKAVLLNAHHDPNAKKALRAYQKTKKFEALTPEDLSTIKETEAIIKMVHSKLE